MDQQRYLFRLSIDPETRTMEMKQAALRASIRIVSEGIPKLIVRHDAQQDRPRNCRRQS